MKIDYARMSKWVMGFLAGTALYCGNALGADDNSKLIVSSRNYFQPGETLVTPHRTWLKPCAGSKIRVLFVIPRNGMREVVELSQRMDMDYKVFAVSDSNKITDEPSFDATPGDLLNERLAYLEELLEQEYDLIVYSSVNWNILPVEARYAILKKVKKGAGLIGAIPDQDDIIKKALSKTAPASDKESLVRMLSGFPYSAVAPFSKANGIEDLVNSTVQPALFGKGRIGMFKYPPGTSRYSFFHPLVPGPATTIWDADLTDYDFQLAYVIRLMLWASRREPGLGVTPATMVMNLEQKDNKGMKFDFMLNNPSEPEKVVCEYMLLDRFGGKIYEEQSRMKIENGKNVAAMKLPWLAAGTYRAVATVRTPEGRYIDFAGGVIQIKGSSCIKVMDLDQSAIRQGESVKGKILIENPSGVMKLRVGIWDNYDRLTAEREYPLSGPVTDSRFEFKIDRPLTIMNTVRAELRDGEGRVVHSERRRFSISNLYPAKDDMRVVLWTGFPSNGTFFAVPVLRYFNSKGIDSQYTSFNPCVPQANLWHVPYATRIVDDKTDYYQWLHRDKSDLVRSPCLTDPKYRNRLKTELTNYLQNCKDYSVSDVSMGDECQFVNDKIDLCFSPTCIADFKRYIQEQYKQIETLNAEYGTSCKTFDEVEPLPLEKAREQNQLSLWVDHRLHMDTVWASIFDYGSRVVREIVPEARVGYEGSDPVVSTWSAGDYWKMSRGMQLNNIYYAPFQAAAWRGFFTPDKMMGLGWFGGYGMPCDEERCSHTHYMPWSTLFKGANSLWIWHAAPLEGSVTAPDYAFYDFFEDSLQQIRAIKAGYGKALLRSQRLTDVGIYYSPASVHTATYLGSPEQEDAFFQNICQLLIDVGFQPRAYSYEEVKQGQLKDNPPMMLYMSYAQSLSSGETRELRKYVEGGGLLIADIRPGVRDAHGKALAKGALDDVFGVRLSVDPGLKQSKVLSVPEEWGVTGSFPLMWYDPFTVPGAGRAKGKIDQVSAIIVNECGRGKAVLLNFIIDKINNYNINEKYAADNPFRKLMRNLAAMNKAEPVVRVAEDVPGLEVTRFQNGRLNYVTFLMNTFPPSDRGRKIDFPSNTPPAVIHVQLPEKGYIYDMLRGGKMGQAQELTMEISRLEPVILACLPYEVKGVGLTLDSKTVKAGEKASYTIEIKGNEPMTEEQIVRVQVLDPSGREVPYYGANVAVRGSQKGEICMAINDVAGRWTIEATDCISGKKAKAMWTVTGGHE